MGDEGTQRRVTLAGATNFRDIGGYPTVAGTQVRWGRVFRADSLHNLDATDLATIDALGITVIYDLRRAAEHEAEPGPRPCVHLELPSRQATDDDFGTLLTRRDGERWLFDDYASMLSNGVAVFGQIFSALAHHQGASVIHCVGGKDRTGITVALLLTVLGVDRQIVLDDYELTSRYRGFEHIPDVVDLFVGLGIARPAAEGMLSAPRWAMADALTLLDHRYGGIDGYLTNEVGLTAGTLAALRDQLVD